MGLIWMLFNNACVGGQGKTKPGDFVRLEYNAIVLNLIRRFAVLSCLFFIVLGSTFVQAQTTPAEPAADSAISLPDASDPSISSEVLTILLTPMTVEELSELSVVWQQVVVEKVNKSAALNIALLDATDEAAVKLREQIVDLADKQAIVSANYTMVLDAWERKGGAPEAVAVHRNYLSALTVEAVRSIDPRALLRLALDWVFSVSGGLALLAKIAGVIVAIYALKIVASIARRFAARSLDKAPDISQLLKRYVLIFAYWLTFFIGIMLVLTFMGINVTPLFAVFGGLSFIVGFAMQETLGNFASGLLIMVLKPFDLGDLIETAGKSGTVDAMSVVSTTIRTFDNQIIIVPNSKVWGDVITNVNAEKTRRVDLVFGIGYSDSIDHAKSVLADAVANHPLCLKEPAPAFGVGELAGSSVNIYCRPWVKTEDYWTVYWDMTGTVKERFDAAGISIPFPQRDVHLIQEKNLET